MMKQTVSHNTAVIYANNDDLSAQNPVYFCKVGGRMLLERLIIQLSRLNVSHFIILSSRAENGAFEALRQRFLKKGLDIQLSESLADRMAPQEDKRCLFIRGDALIDDRILQSLMTKDGSDVVAVHNPDPQDKNQIKHPIAVKTSLHQIKPHLESDENQDFAHICAGIADKVTTLDIADLDTYVANRRRKIPILFQIITDHSDLGKMTDLVLSMTQKGTLDWPAKWVHPFFENFLVRLCLPTMITPNMVTVLTGIFGFWVTWLFAEGNMIAATAGAMLVGVLDGVDGKLARTKMLETSIGELEHLMDKILEYSWYFAIAWFLAPLYGGAIWALPIIAVGFALAETVQGEFYRRLTGVQLDDSGLWERRWRLISGRRNTFIWTFMPFALVGYVYQGLWMIALYSLITFLIAQISFIIRLKAYAGAHSTQMKENLSQTAYW